MLALVCLGCGDGSSLVSVTGKVTLDGEPLPGADVSFRPNGKGETAYATTAQDGSFSLQTIRQKPGAAPGTYRVTVSKVESPEYEGKSDTMPIDLDPRKYQSTWLTPKRYSNPETSGFKVRVTEGMAPVELELNSQ